MMPSSMRAARVSRMSHEMTRMFLAMDGNCLPAAHAERERVHCPTVVMNLHRWNRIMRAESFTNRMIRSALRAGYESGAGPGE